MSSFLVIDRGTTDAAVRVRGGRTPCGARTSTVVANRRTPRHRVLVLLACAARGDAEPGDAGTARAASRLVLSAWDARGEHLVLVELGRSRARTLRLGQVAGGDAPYHVVATGRRVVFYGGRGAYVLDPAKPRRPRGLAPAWYLVPSATPGRVWLTTPDPASPDTVRSLSGVREVTLAGRRPTAR
jgi:hypothetical protein